MGRNIRIEIYTDTDAECPMDWESSWNLVSFKRDSIHKGDRNEYVRETAEGKSIPATIGLVSKLRHGLAFWLDYYEHGLARYDIAGSGPRCEWDSVSCAGLLVWEHPPKDMGAKTLEDRRKDAECFLSQYNDWMNGSVYQYMIETEAGDHIDSCGGIYDTDAKYLTQCVLEHLLPGDKIIIEGEAAFMFNESLVPSEIEVVEDFDKDEDEDEDEEYETEEQECGNY